MSDKPGFVFDTNAFISVALLPESVNKRAIQKAEQAGHILISKETLLELTEVLVRPKFDKYLSLEERFEFIARIELRYKLIEVVSDVHDCTDSNDNKFLNLAIDANASCIITGDKHLLTMHPYRGIPILNAADFLTSF